MVVEGSVTKVKKLDAREGSDGDVYSLSIEGFGLLAKDQAMALPAVGAFIRGKVSVYWPKSGRPVYWLTAWSLGTV